MSFEDFKSGAGFLGLHYIVDPLLKVPPPIDLDVVVLIFTRNSAFHAILLVKEFLLVPSAMCQSPIPNRDEPACPYHIVLFGDVLDNTVYCMVFPSLVCASDG